MWLDTWRTTVNVTTFIKTERIFFLPLLRYPQPLYDNAVSIEAGFLVKFAKHLLI